MDKTNKIKTIFGIETQGVDNLKKTEDALKGSASAADKAERSVGKLKVAEGSLTSENEKLAKTLGVTKDTLGGMGERFEGLDSDFVSLSARMREATKDSEQFGGIIKGATNWLADYERKMQDGTAEYGDYEGALRKVLILKQQAVDKFGKNSEVVAQLTDKYKKLTEQARYVKAAEDSGTQAVERGAAAAAQASASFGQFATAMSSTGTSLGQVVGGLGSAVGIVSSLPAQMKAIEHSMGGMNSGLKTAAKGLMGLGVGVGAAMAVVSALNAVIAAQDELIKKRAEAANAIEAEIQAYEKSAQTVNNRIESAEKLMEKNSELGWSLIKLAGDEKTYKDELNKVSDAQVQARAKAKELEQAGVSPLLRVIQNLNPAIAESRRELALQTIALEDARKAAMSAMKTYQQMSDTLGTAQKSLEIQMMQQEIDRLKALGDIQGARALEEKKALLEAQEANKGLAKEAEKASARLKELPSELGEAKRKLLELEEDYTSKLIAFNKGVTDTFGNSLGYTKTAANLVEEINRGISENLKSFGVEFEMTEGKLTQVFQRMQSEGETFYQAFDNLFVELRDEAGRAFDWDIGGKLQGLVNGDGGLVFKNYMLQLAATRGEVEALSLEQDNLNKTVTTYSEIVDVTTEKVKSGFASQAAIEALQDTKEAVEEVTAATEELVETVGRVDLDVALAKPTQQAKDSWISALTAMLGVTQDEFAPGINKAIEWITNSTRTDLESMQGDAANAVDLLLDGMFGTRWMNLEGHKGAVQEAMQPFFDFMGIVDKDPTPKIETMRQAVEQMVPLFEQLGISSQKINEMIAKADLIDDANRRIQAAQEEANHLILGIKNRINELDIQEEQTIERIKVVQAKWLEMFTEKLSPLEKRGYDLMSKTKADLLAYPELSKEIWAKFSEDYNSILDEVNKAQHDVWKGQREVLVGNYDQAMSNIEAHKQSMLSTLGLIDSKIAELEGRSKDVRSRIEESLMSPQERLTKKYRDEFQSLMEDVKSLSPEDVAAMGGIEKINEYIRQERTRILQAYMAEVGQENLRLGIEMDPAAQSKFNTEMDKTLASVFGLENTQTGIDKQQGGHVLRVGIDWANVTETDDELAQLKKDAADLRSILGEMTLPPTLHETARQAITEFETLTTKAAEAKNQLDLFGDFKGIEKQDVELAMKLGDSESAIKDISQQLEDSMLGAISINELGIPMPDMEKLKQAGSIASERMRKELGLTEAQITSVLDMVENEGLTIEQAIGKIVDEIKGDEMAQGMIKFLEQAKEAERKIADVGAAFGNVKTQAWDEFEKAFTDPEKGILSVMAMPDGQIGKQVLEAMAALGHEPSIKMKDAIKEELGEKQSPSLPGEMEKHGKLANSMFAQGLWSMFGENPTKEAVNSMAQYIVDHFEMHSPAKLGPLSKTYPEEWGYSLVRLLNLGILSAKDVLVGSVEDLAGKIAEAFNYDTAVAAPLTDYLLQFREIYTGSVDRMNTENLLKMQEDASQKREYELFYELMTTSRPLDNAKGWHEAFTGGTNYDKYAEDWYTGIGLQQGSIISLMQSDPQKFEQWLKNNPSARSNFVKDSETGRWRAKNNYTVPSKSPDTPEGLQTWDEFLNDTYRDFVKKTYKSESDYTLASHNRDFWMSNDMEDLVKKYTRYVTENAGDLSTIRTSDSEFLTNLLGKYSDTELAGQLEGSEVDPATGLPKALTESKWWQAFVRPISEREAAYTYGDVRTQLMGAMLDPSRVKELGLNASFDIKNALGLLLDPNSANGAYDLLEHSFEQLIGMYGGGAGLVGGDVVGYNTNRARAQQKAIAALLGFDFDSYDHLQGFGSSQALKNYKRGVGSFEELMGTSSGLWDVFDKDAINRLNELLESGYSNQDAADYLAKQIAKEQVASRVDQLNNSNADYPMAGYLADPLWVLLNEGKATEMLADMLKSQSDTRKKYGSSLLGKDARSKNGGFFGDGDYTTGQGMDEGFGYDMLPFVWSSKYKEYTDIDRLEQLTKKQENMLKMGQFTGSAWGIVDVTSDGLAKSGYTGSLAGHGAGAEMAGYWETKRRSEESMYGKQTYADRQITQTAQTTTGGGAVSVGKFEVNQYIQLNGGTPGSINNIIADLAQRAIVEFQERLLDMVNWRG